jgi:hypothetical protein
MVQATFTVSGSDFTAEVFEQIRTFVRSQKECEVFIKVTMKESREQMRKRIEQSAAEMGRGENTVFLSGEAFEKL